MIPLIALSVYYIISLPNFPIHDFSNSYFSSLFFSSDFISIFDPYFFNKKISDLGVSGVFASFNPNPPSVAILFFPLTYLNSIAAKIAFTSFSLCLFLFSIYRLSRYKEVPIEIVFIIIPIVFFIPIKTNILFGQTYLLVTSLLIEGFLASQKKRFIWASIFWSVAIFLKLFPLIIFFYLFLKKDYKQALILFATCTIFFLMAISLQGIDIWKYYLIEVLPRTISGDLHSSYTTATQSAIMVAKYAFQADPIFNTKPLIDNKILFFIFLGSFSSFILAACSRVIKNNKSSLFSYCFILLGAQLLSPQGSTYSNILLLLLLVESFSNKKRFLIYTIIILIISNLPISAFQSLPLFFRFPRLSILLFLFCILLYHTGVWPNWKTMAILFVIITVPKIVKSSVEVDPSLTYIDVEREPLIIDYKVSGNRLSYTYWQENGEVTKITNYKIDSQLKDLVIENNQIILHGKRITQSPDNKKHASLIGANEIIYLSDKGKGIGFYALRRIVLP